MKSKSEVEIRGTANGLVILLDPEAPVERLAQALRAKLAAARGFFAGADCQLRWRDRPQEADLPELAQILAEYGLLLRSPAPQKPSPVVALPGRTAEVIALPSHQAMLVQGLVRGGQTVRHPSHVVILGHVNPGGRVEAGGHVIVLGKLAGTVLAGYPDNTRAAVWTWVLASRKVAVAGRYLPLEADLPSGPAVVRLCHHRVRAEAWSGSRQR